MRSHPQPRALPKTAACTFLGRGRCTSGFDQMGGEAVVCAFALFIYFQIPKVFCGIFFLMQVQGGPKMSQGSIEQGPNSKNQKKTDVFGSMSCHWGGGWVGKQGDICKPHHEEISENVSPDNLGHRAYSVCQPHQPRWGGWRWTVTQAAGCGDLWRGVGPEFQHKAGIGDLSNRGSSSDLPLGRTPRLTCDRHTKTWKRVVV